MQLKLLSRGFRINATPFSLFGSLFFLATAIAAYITYHTISRAEFGEIGSFPALAVLIGNGILILILSALLIQRILYLRRVHWRDGGGDLARHFTMLFGLSVMLPAILLATFFGANLNRSLDEWFGERVHTVMTRAADIGHANMDLALDDVRSKIRVMASDLNNARDGLEEDIEKYRYYLNAQATLRDFYQAMVITRDKKVLAHANLSIQSNPSEFIISTQEEFSEADAGQVALRINEKIYAVHALYKLTTYQDAYLFVTRALRPGLVETLTAARTALDDYVIVQHQTSRLQTIFTISYIEISILILLFAIRFGIDASIDITVPISRLSHAARIVRDGDLNISLDPNLGHDEIRGLTKSFNDMVAQLLRQRDDLRHAQAESDQKRQFIEAVLSDVSAGVLRLDPNLTVTLSNSSARNLMEAETLEGKNLKSFAKEFVPCVEKAVAKSVTQEAEIQMSRKGRNRHMRITATPEEGDGCVLTFDDTTRLVMAQRQAVWKGVARRIAHEIRNPLTPIQLAAERLQKRYANQIAPDDSVFTKCIDTVYRQVGDIERMINAFSDLASMPSPNKCNFDIVELIDKTVFEQQLVSPNIEFRFNKTYDVIHVIADEQLLRQVFRNIFKNAAEAISGFRDKKPDSVNDVITIDIFLNENEFIIDIVDTGPGFDHEYRESVLEPYVTTRPEGTGLGLAIVYRIIQEHEGQLLLLDREDGYQGARVRIILPLKGHSNHSMDGNLLAQETL